jgi:hypothetical protein
MKKLIAVILLATGSMFGQVSFGIRLGQPPLRAWNALDRELRAPTTSGWTVIGIPKEIDTAGMTGIGLGRPMRVPPG